MVEQSETTGQCSLCAEGNAGTGGVAETTNLELEQPRGESPGQAGVVEPVPVEPPPPHPAEASFAGKESPGPAAPAMASEAVSNAVKGMALTNADGDSVTYVSHRLLEPQRQQVLASSFPQCAEGAEVVAIVVTESSGATKELTALAKGDATPELIVGSCSISMEDLLPSDCIEYAFPEAPDVWRMAQLSRDALEHYRSMKFESWKKMLLEPTCEAQFRRMLQIGLVNRLYDPHVFPTPEEFKGTYQVTDDRNGKLIQLPHPVAELRVWDASAQAYEKIDSLLTGAPADAEKESFWQTFLGEVKTTLLQKNFYGEDEINGLISGGK